MDRRMTVYERTGIRLHLMMCVLCRRYRKQLLLIRSLLRKDNSDTTTHHLSEEARKRIARELTNETD
nr:hypothetical protein [Desulfomarina profundi]